MRKVRRRAAAARVVQPASWPRPRGYANGILFPAGGRILFVAGQIAWDASGKIVCPDFPCQFKQALENVVHVVRASGGEPSGIGRLTIYVADKREYAKNRRAVGEAYREVMGQHYPAMSLIEVKSLLEPGAKVEIEATAVVP